MKFKMEIIARNIVNHEAITDFISKVSKDQSDKIKIWCNTILKNYLKNEYDNLKEITKSKKDDPVWLQEAVKRKDAQKIVIDKDFERLLIEHIFHYFDTLQGNLKHTFTEAEKQTKEWENKENLFNIKLTKGVKEILKCEGGYTWFEIIDEETLYNEGEIIQNCLRKKQHGPEYWKKIKKSKIKIFTLRDSKGIGHVGVEYNIKENEIYQMLGKQNDDPIEIYHPFCIELLKYLKCKVSDISILIYLKVTIINNKIYNIFNLPKGLIVNGDLNLKYYGKESEFEVKLPNDLTIKGNLNLFMANIKKLPENLTIKGNLDLGYAEIKKFPQSLKVSKNIYINSDQLKYIPKHLVSKVKIHNYTY